MPEVKGLWPAVSWLIVILTTRSTRDQHKGSASPNEGYGGELVPLPHMQPLGRKGQRRGLLRYGFLSRAAIQHHAGGRDDKIRRCDKEQRVVERESGEQV